jgi:hypothetical protein
MPKHPTWRTKVFLFAWVITLDLSGMGGPTSSIRYRQHSSWDHVTTHTPHHYIKVGIPAGGTADSYDYIITKLSENLISAFFKF